MSAAATSTAPRTGALSPEELARWNRDGFLHPFNALSTAEAAMRRAKLEDWERRSGQNVLKACGLKAHLIFTWCHSVATHPAILDRVESIIGPDILIYSSSIWPKTPGDNKYVSWHQDSGYLGIDPADGLQAWVALSDSNTANGCLRILPGSHHNPDVVHEETFHPDNMVSRGQVIHGIPEEKAVDIELKAGQFSLHHERTFHASGPNNGGDRRIGYSILYIPASSRCTISRRGALLARGQDRWNNWDAEAPPVRDEDPAAFEYLTKAWAAFRDRSIPQGAVQPH